jgi:hypothetical protein
MPFPARRLAPVIAVAGSSCFAAAWILLATALGSQCSWMAVLGALDAALLLRLCRARPGWTRAAWGVIATAAAIAIANWGIAATHIGKAMGLLPWDSALRLGSGHAWTLLQLANDVVDLAWLAAALVIAAVVSR